MLELCDIEAIASRVVDLLHADAPPFPSRGLVTTEQVKQLLQVEREWVYDHKAELGAVRLGDAERAPLRFEAAKVLDYVKAHRLGAEQKEATRRVGRPRRAARGGKFEVLPIPQGVRA